MLRSPLPHQTVRHPLMRYMYIIQSGALMINDVPVTRSRVFLFHACFINTLERSVDQTSSILGAGISLIKAIIVSIKN